MGDPKFSRRRYETPSHPWQANRIREETELAHRYGLKNKTEVWKARSYLRRFRRQARILQGRIRLKDPQAEREAKALLSRLYREGFLENEATLDDVLALNVEAVLRRRLQTLVHLKGYASTLTQARQLIVHGHVAIQNRRVTVPGMIVPRALEGLISYAPGSPLENPDHPVRPKFETLPVIPEASPDDLLVTPRRGGGGSAGRKRGYETRERRGSEGGG